MIQMKCWGTQIAYGQRQEIRRCSPHLATENHAAHQNQKRAEPGFHFPGVRVKTCHAHPNRNRVQAMNHPSRNQLTHGDEKQIRLPIMAGTNKHMTLEF